MRRRLPEPLRVRGGMAAYMAEYLFNENGEVVTDPAEASRASRTYYGADGEFLTELFEALDPEHLTAAIDEDEKPKAAPHWAGVLAVEGIATGDGRLIEPGALSWDLPLPLLWVDRASGGHAGAQVVGRIDAVSRSGDVIEGSGVLDLSGVAGAEVARLMADGMAGGISMDLDDVDISVRVAAEVLEGFAEQEAELLEEGETPDLDVDADGRVEVVSMKADDELMVTTRARIRAATLVSIPAFAEAMVTLTDAGRSALTPDAPAVEEGLAASAARLGLDPAAVVAAASRAPAVPTVPPAEWFTKAHLEVRVAEAGGPVPMEYGEDGRVSGYLALFGACHTGFRTCVQAPRQGKAGYDSFHTGSVFAEDEHGDEIVIPTGRISLGGGHAPLDAPAYGAAEHYDSTSAAVADVVADEDEHGVYVVGALRPGISAERLRELRAAPLSGDWRQLPGGRGLRLMAALAVNVPGFPVPHPAARVASSGNAKALLTSTGIVTETELTRRRLLDLEAELNAPLVASLEADLFGAQVDRMTSDLEG